MRTRLGDFNRKLPPDAVNAWLDGDPARIEQLRTRAQQRMPSERPATPKIRREVVLEIAHEHGLLDDRVPDLFDVLPPGDPDREWVTEVRGALDELHGRGVHVAVDRCEWVPGPDGWLAIVGVNVSGGTEILPGDLLHGGFAATRGPDGRLEVVPRLHRALCANGSVMHERDEPGVLQSPQTVRAAVQRCLSNEVLERQVDRLREASRAPVAVVEGMLHRLRPERRPPPVRPDDSPDFLRLQRRAMWVLLNALTAAARAEPDLLERLDRERDVARILAWLRAARPERHAARARTLDASAEIELVDVG